MMKYLIFAYAKDTLGTLDLCLKGLKFETKYVEDVATKKSNVVVRIASSSEDGKEKLDITFNGCSLDHVLNVSSKEKELLIKFRCSEPLIRYPQNNDDTKCVSERERRMQKMGDAIAKSNFLCKCIKCSENILSSTDFKVFELSRSSFFDSVENVWCFCGCNSNCHLNVKKLCNHCHVNNLLKSIEIDTNSELSFYDKCFILDSQILFYSTLDATRKLNNGTIKVGDKNSLECGNCHAFLGFSRPPEDSKITSNGLVRCKIDFNAIQIVTPDAELSAWALNSADLELAVSSEIVKLNKDHNTHRFVFKVPNSACIHMNVLSMDTVVYTEEVDTVKDATVDVTLKQRRVLMVVINHDEEWSDGFYFDTIDLPCHKGSQFLRIINTNSSLLPSSLQAHPSKTVSFLKRL